MKTGCDLCCDMLPQCEAVRACRFPIATMLYLTEYLLIIGSLNTRLIIYTVFHCWLMSDRLAISVAQALFIPVDLELTGI